MLEDRVADDDLLCLHKWAVGDAGLAARNAHLGAHGDRRQPAILTARQDRSKTEGPEK